jgi:hypothetical protein
MRWYLKSLAFKFFSTIPGGERCYRFSQRNISRSTLATAPRLKQKLEVGLMYWDWLKKHHCTELLTNGPVIDYGAGWHPTIPILFQCLGAKKQALLDVSPLLTARHLQDTLEIVGAVIADPLWPGRAEIKKMPPVPPPGKNRLLPLLEALQLDYYAPYAVGYPSQPDSVGSIYCTQVLQHLSPEVQLKVFKELYGWLRPGGLFMATIHLIGHFGRPSTDPRQYQHLQYSPWLWNHLFSSSLMYYNRCKAPDFLANLEAAGFRIREFDVTRANAEEMKFFGRTKVHPCFRHLPAEELAARHLFFVAEKS